MIADELRELLNREPFAPFRVVMSSGKTYEIANPDLVVVMKSEFFVAFPDGEHWAHVPYLHVAGIESVKNGGRRKPPRRKRKP